MNTELWQKAFKTDPKHVKEITGKQYKGNSPKPYHLIDRANQIFGDCGDRWGIRVVSERFERLSDTYVFHVALVEFWYVLKEKTCTIQQMGQTKACYMSSASKLIVDEDAPKKSVTDAMVKCMSMIGFAGDIFSGRWDDSKYVAEINAEFRSAENPKNPPVAASEKITPEQLRELDGLLEMSGADRPKFFKACAINALAEMQESQFARAKDALVKKLNQSTSGV